MRILQARRPKLIRGRQKHAAGSTMHRWKMETYGRPAATIQHNAHDMTWHERPLRSEQDWI